MSCSLVSGKLSRYNCGQADAASQPASSNKKRALDPRKKRRRVRILSEEGLVLYFRHRLRAYVICNFRFKTTMQFRVLYPVFFYGFSRKKNRVTKKTSSLFLMTCKYKTYLCKSRSREDDFSSKRQREADIEFPFCVKCHGQVRMRTTTKQTN